MDVWTSTASTGTTVNPITYAFHYVLFANDPTIYCYEVLNHSATDPATSVGQGQFLFRSNPSLFPNLYQINTGPNQLGTANAQTTIGVPSTNPNFGTVTAQAGRTVSNVTYDLTGSGIAGDNGTNFFTEALFGAFVRALRDGGALGADFYGYHGQTRCWLQQLGFRESAHHPDGRSIPSRFQPLDGKGGGILSAMFLQSELPACADAADCPWYWTKSDSDQDRPN